MFGFPALTDWSGACCNSLLVSWLEGWGSFRLWFWVLPLGLHSSHPAGQGSHSLFSFKTAPFLHFKHLAVSVYSHWAHKVASHLKHFFVEEWAFHENPSTQVRQLSLLASSQVLQGSLQTLHTLPECKVAGFRQEVQVVASVIQVLHIEFSEHLSHWFPLATYPGSQVLQAELVQSRQLSGQAAHTSTPLT